jgi:hypothetical protein
MIKKKKILIALLLAYLLIDLSSYFLNNLFKDTVGVLGYKYEPLTLLIIDWILIISIIISYFKNKFYNRIFVITILLLLFLKPLLQFYFYDEIFRKSFLSNFYFLQILVIVIFFFEIRKQDTNRVM